MDALPVLKEVERLIAENASLKAQLASYRQAHTLALKAVMKTRTSQELDCLLDEVWSYLDDRADVTDGDYGTQRPNQAMSLASEVQKMQDRLKAEGVFKS